MITTKQRLDEKVEQAAREYQIVSQTSGCADNGIDFGTIHGANLLSPLLLVMFELIKDIEPSVLAELHRIRRHDALNKFEEFLK